MPHLWIHHVLSESQANGPGRRFVIWVQGCTLGCPGCFNPETHPAGRGTRILVDQLLAQIMKAEPSIEGVTISGGEPLQQASAVSNLVSLIKEKTSLSTILFSGFGWSEIQRIPYYRAIIDHIDVLIAGRFRQELRIAKNLVGSTNKTFHFFTSRYSVGDFENVPPAEAVILPDGQIVLSGIDPLIWPSIP